MLIIQSECSKFIHPLTNLFQREFSYYVQPIVFEFNYPRARCGEVCDESGRKEFGQHLRFKTELRLPFRQIMLWHS